MDQKGPVCNKAASGSSCPSGFCFQAVDTRRTIYRKIWSIWMVNIRRSLVNPNKWPLVSEWSLCVKVPDRGRISPLISRPSTILAFDLRSDHLNRIYEYSTPPSLWLLTLTWSKSTKCINSHLIKFVRETILVY